jgi:hypothetical protein
VGTSPQNKADAPPGAPVSTHNSRTTHNCPTNSPTSLTVVILPTLVANAFVTAVFSNVAGRYQARVIWLVPLLAALMALDLFTRSAQLDSPTKKIDAPKGAPATN